MNKWLLMAGGVLAVAAAMGGNEAIIQQERAAAVAEFHQAPAAEMQSRKPGEEIKSLRTRTSETFKADSALVIRPDGAMVRVARFHSRVYAGPKYFKDADVDTLRPLDLTVREISALAALNPLRTHDKYVDAGPYTARWMNDRPGDIHMEAGGVILEYRALHDTTGITVRMEPTADGMKETVTIADSTAAGSASSPSAHTLRWVVETDGSLVAQADNSFAVRAGDASTPLCIERPKAWDAAGNPVMAVASVAGDTLTFRVTVLPGQEYPVTVDPTTTAVIGVAAKSIQNSDAVYLTARNAPTGNSASNNYLGYSSTGKVTQREYMNFPITVSMSACDACTLFVDGYDDNSTVDFGIHIYGARKSRSAYTTADFSNFSNWAASGAYDSSKVLNNTWHTASYSAGWNALIFNSTGRDSMRVAQNDTLWIVLLSNLDVMASEPGNNANIGFTETGGSAPYLSFTYTIPAINPPTEFLISPIPGAQDSLLLSWAKNYSNSIDSLVLYRWPDSVRVATLVKTAATSRIGGLNPYTRYRWYVRADSLHIYGYSNPDSCWTTQTFKTEDFPIVNYGHVRNNATAVYDSARAEIKTDSLSTGTAWLGQQKLGSNYLVFRHFQNIALPAMMKAHAETLVVKGSADSSVTDFSILARSGTWTAETAAKEKYFAFDGWQSLLTAYTGNPLTVSFSTAGFTTGATLNKLAFTQAGRDTTIKRRAAGDSLKILLLSSRDGAATAPSGNEHVLIDGTNSWLRLTYAPPDSAPNGFTLTLISTDSLLASWTDRSYSERGYIVVDAVSGSKVAGTDTTAANAASQRIGGLSANTSYAWKVKAVGGGADGLTSAEDSCYTRAATPGKPTVTIPADSLIKFILNAGGNPSYTEFTVQDSLTGKYVDFISGAADTFSTTAEWRTYAGWGGANGDTIRVRPGGFHVIRVKARNGQ